MRGGSETESVVLTKQLAHYTTKREDPSEKRRKLLDSWVQSKKGKKRETHAGVKGDNGTNPAITKGEEKLFKRNKEKEF